MRDQSVLRAKVQLIDDKIIQYKRWDNLDGPSYKISLESVQSIHYENGTSDTFPKEDFNNDNLNSMIVSNSEKNNDLINKFNSLSELSIEDLSSSKDAKDVRFFFSLSNGSRMADKNLTIFIKKEYDLESDRFFRRLHFINTSEQILYIDLANTFVVARPFRYYADENDENNNVIAQLGLLKNSYDCFYDSSITYESTGATKGVSLGLGALTGALGLSGSAQQIANGIGLSGTSSKVVTKSKQQERIVAIPPHSTYVSEHIEISFAVTLPTVKRKQIKIGEVKTWTPENTPTSIQYYTTYSLTPSFTNYKVLFLDYYISQLIGLERKRIPSNIFWSFNDFMTFESHGVPLQAIIEDHFTFK